MEEKKKLSTADILKAARAQAGKAEPAASESATPPPANEGASSPAPAKAAPAAGGAPKSTKDILAAARAQAASGEQTPKAQAPAAPSAAPKSTKDILAAARAQKASAPAAAATGSTPAAKPAAAAAAKVVGDRPSVQDMLKAVREGKPVGPEEPGVAAKPQLPPTPQRPAPPVKKAIVQPTRRNVVLAMLLAPFSSAFSTAWTLFGTATAAFTLALARFMMPNVLVEPPSKFKVGPPGDYPVGTVSNKWKAEFAVWIVHTVYNGHNVIYALSTVCTHLGCTPNWLEGEQKFKCPCHGSGFYPNGINFEGPAPRPLERYAIRVAEDGMLEVDRSRKFQQEMGQWTDASSFVEVA